MCADSREDGDTQTFRFVLDQTISPKKPGHCAAAALFHCTFALLHYSTALLLARVVTPFEGQHDRSLLYYPPSFEEVIWQADQSLLRVTLGDCTWALTRNCVTKGGRLQMTCAHASVQGSSTPLMVAHIDVDHEGEWANGASCALYSALICTLTFPLERCADCVWHRD